MRRTLCPVLAFALALTLPRSGAKADGSVKESEAESTRMAQTAQFTQKVAAAQINLDKLEEPLRGKVTRLLQQPAFYSRTPTRAFPTRPAVYHWLLDNPHLAARAWQGLGAKCATIEKKGEGVFIGVDPLGERHGSARWENICEQPGWRVWYAEGTGRAAPFAPAVTVRCLVLLTYQDVRGGDGRLGIRHQIEVLSQFEGRTTGWLARLGAATVDSSARRTLEQVELFFSGMAWYLSSNPASAKKLLASPGGDGPEEIRQVEMVLRQLDERP